MNKTLRISFSLKNTYRVNSILYSLKQIPLIKKLLPESLYSVRGLKIFANVLSIIWEVASTFLGKLLYFLAFFLGASMLYSEIPKDGFFLHVLLCLTLIGTYTNTKLFDPSKDKYYAIILMRMNARRYTVVNYLYAMGKVVVGFLPFTLLFGLINGLPLWFCLLLPLCIAGMKLFIVSLFLWNYERRGVGYNENRLTKYAWGGMGLLLIAAYAPPFFGYTLPVILSMSVFLLCLPLGAVGLMKTLTFRDYGGINHELLTGQPLKMDSSAQAQLAKQASEKKISADTSLTSDRTGFEYLNELFIKRHKKILWGSVKKISCGSILFFTAALIALYMIPSSHSDVNRMVMTGLPNFLFLMYFINRGTGFTRALFLNCDHSLLTYSFYKQPAFILRLFQIRLREIMKINAVPALIIGIGLSLVLFASGGTDHPLDYVVLIVSILFMSLFFSIHYLTAYYLLQPYNAGTEMKSGVYRVVLSTTYLLCYFIRQLELPIMLFGVMMIVFSVAYTIVASILVYRFAPKTFKIRV